MSHRLARMTSTLSSHGVDQRDRRERCFDPATRSDLQIPHEATGGEPEIVPHQHNRLRMLAIAVPKRGDQLRVLFTSLGMEPLLELVQDEQHLPPRRQDATPSQIRQRFDQCPSSGTVPDTPFVSPASTWLRSPPRSPRRKPERRAFPAGAGAPPSPAMTCRNPRDRRSAPP